MSEYLQRPEAAKKNTREKYTAPIGTTSRWCRTLATQQPIRNEESKRPLLQEKKQRSLVSFSKGSPTPYSTIRLPTHPPTHHTPTPSPSSLLLLLPPPPSRPAPTIFRVSLLSQHSSCFLRFRVVHQFALARGFIGARLGTAFRIQCVCGVECKSN